MPTTTALLIIDAQEGYFNGKATFLAQPEPLFNINNAQENLLKVVHQARKLGYPIIFIKHEGLELGEIHESLLPLEPQDKVIWKAEPSSFFNTNLHELLQSTNSSKLILVGYQTDVCIKSTAEDALKLHYSVTVVEDAVAAQTEERHLEALRNMDITIARMNVGSDLAVA